MAYDTQVVECVRDEHEGTLCCTTSDRPDDSRNECATTTSAASETEHHPYIEHPFAAQ